MRAKIGRGYWIGLNSLEGVAGLLDKIEAEADRLKRADFVVVDLRGNGGGSTQYANRLYTALFGSERVLKARQPAPCSGTYYRTSKGNADYMARHWGQAAGLKLRVMGILGRDLNPAFRVCRATGPAAVAEQAVDDPRLIIIIDRNCFSSCLLTVETGRRLGAGGRNDADQSALSRGSPRAGAQRHGAGLQPDGGRDGRGRVWPLPAPFCL